MLGVHRYLLGAVLYAGVADASRAPAQAATPGLSAAQQPQIPALMNVSALI